MTTAAPWILRQRRLLGRIAAAAFAACLAAPLHAETWPSKAVTLVVPFPPGGTTDVLARALAEKLAPALGQPVVVENKPGAGATLGAEQVAKGKADGHTLLMGAVHHTIAGSIYKKLGYDFQKDFAPISTVALVPNVVVVGPATPAKNVSELVAFAKSRPGQVAYGSNGNGTAQHLIGTQFENANGIDLVHVPYKGSGPLTTDLLGGQINLSFDTVTPVLQQVRSGKLRALAVTTAKRSSALPEVPTLQELGYKGFDLGTWFGVLAPAATPKDVVVRLHSEITKALATPDLRKRLDEIGAEPIGNTPDAMAKQIRDETLRFAEIVKTAKVTIE